MNFRHFIEISLCSFVFIYGTGTTVAQNHASSFVDPNIVLQENFQGWGTSLAWWADMVGGMEQNIADHIVDALFSPSKLNLNIVRYVIGGTTPGNHTCGEFRDGGATESFKDGFDSPFDWNRDSRQIKTLQMAKEKGADTFEAFSNTPPQWMTISGCSKGNYRAPLLFANLDASKAAYFADYATEVIKYFHDTLNITFTTYGPFNEPYGLHGIGGWIGPLQNQEGCNMGRPLMATVIKSINEAQLAKNLTFFKIAVSDETQVNTQVQSYDYFVQADVSGLFQQVNVHGYHEDYEVSRRDLLSSRCSRNGHELWMDEMGFAGSAKDNMEQGLIIANRIVLDLRIMIPSAWVYWQAVEDVGAWRLIELPYTDSSLDKIAYNSGYYALQQFSQHIRKGYKLISISDKNSVAAISGDRRDLVIVMVNSETANATHEIDVSLIESIGSISLTRTSASEQHINLPSPIMTDTGKLQLLLPPESISTIELSNVTFVERNVTNYIANGDFESVTEAEDGTLQPDSWTLHYSGIGRFDGVTQQDPWRGDYSGALNIALLGNTTLVQEVKIVADDNDSECSVYLTATCSSTRTGTKFGVLINDNQQEIEIASNSVSVSYGISFNAVVGDTAQIYFTNSGSLLSGTAKIDNVYLHTACK